MGLDYGDMRAAIALLAPPPSRPGFEQPGWAHDVKLWQRAANEVARVLGEPDPYPERKTIGGWPACIACGERGVVWSATGERCDSCRDPALSFSLQLRALARSRPVANMLILPADIDLRNASDDELRRLITDTAPEEKP